MCILALAVDAHDDYPLVLAHNRDEYFARSTGPLQQHGDILCALDHASSGTWMGINVRTGNFAALTNVRAHQPSGVRSRGELVNRVLQGKAAVACESTDYAAYNLLHGNLCDGRPIHLTTSVPPDWQPRTSELPSGSVVVKSNDEGGGLTTTEEHDGEFVWPKAVWLHSQVRAALSVGAELVGEDGARALIAALEPAMSAQVMPSAHATAAAAFMPSPVSPLSVSDERTVQRAPRVAPFELHGPHAPKASSLYGTVSQSFLVQCRSEACVLYAYRELPRGPPTASSTATATAGFTAGPTASRSGGGTTRVPTCIDGTGIGGEGRGSGGAGSLSGAGSIGDTELPSWTWHRIPLPTAVLGPVADGGRGGSKRKADTIPGGMATEQLSAN